MNTDTEPSTKSLNIRPFAYGGLVCLILLQTLLLFYCGLNKSGYYGDEAVTYLLANDVDGGFLQFHEDALNNWVDGDYYSELMTMDNNCRFDFSVPYHNQELDVHPPLYYFVVHFACSLFPNGDWKWIGLGINICFSVILSVFLFLLARKITGSYGISLLTVAGYIFSLGFINTVTFLRMYTMLTMWCVIFAWLLTGLVQNIYHGQKVRFRTYFGLFLITFCGTLTQYYFLIFAFFLCLGALIYTLIKKQWKPACIFTVSEFAGIGCAVAFFPAMLTHIFLGYRGTDAIGSVFDFTDYFSNLSDTLFIFNKELFGGLFVPIAVILCILAILSCVMLNIHIHKDSKLPQHVYAPRKCSFQREGWTGILLASCVCYVLLVVDISPYLSDRYYMCLYPFFIFAFVLSAYNILSAFLSNRLNTYMVILCCILITSASAWIQYSADYLWPITDTTNTATSREEILSDYEQYPAILADFTENGTFMHGFIYDWQKNTHVYHFHSDTYEDLINVLENSNLSDGFLLYVINPHYSSTNVTVDSTYTGVTVLETLSRTYPMTYKMILSNGNIDTYFCIPE